MVYCAEMINVFLLSITNVTLSSVHTEWRLLDGDSNPYNIIIEKIWIITLIKIPL